MKDIPLKIESGLEDGLLCFGIPFVEGAMTSDDGINLVHGEMELPIWYQVRSAWPDGSVRWIFLHARVPAGRHDMKLCLLEGGRRSWEEGSFDHGLLAVGDTSFAITDRGFEFRTPDGSALYLEDRIESDLATGEFAPSRWSIGIVENSPLSPMIRVTENAKGFYRDFLIRIDPVLRQLTIQRKMAPIEEGFFHLNKAAATVHFDTDIGTGSLSVVEFGKYRKDGVMTEGFPSSTFRWNGAALHVEKMWQRYPFALDWSANVLNLQVYPEIAEALPVTGGMEYRHTIKLACDGVGVPSIDNAVKLIIDPEHMAESFAVGRIHVPNEKVAFPAYEQSFYKGVVEAKSDPERNGEYAAGIEEEQKQHPYFFGLPYYGDFPMGKKIADFDRPSNYWDNEYDASFGFYRVFAAYADHRFLDQARAHGIHMSDMDINSITGDMKCHGSSHLHNDNPAYQKSEMGHVWSDGCWLTYLFFGDLWAKENAERLARSVFSSMDTREKMVSSYCFAERYLGWPLVTILPALETTGEEEYLSYCRAIVDYLAEFFADPEGELEKDYTYDGEPSEFYRTALSDGCKPFMMGIIMEGLERYYLCTHDNRVADILKVAADFIIDNMWDENRETFQYEYNAYSQGHNDSLEQTLASLFIRGFAFAYELTGIHKFRSVATRAFHALTWFLSAQKDSGGKNIAQISRSLGGFVEFLAKWTDEDDRRTIASCKPSKAKPFVWEKGIRELVECDYLTLVKGVPEFDGDALISNETSYADLRFKEGVNSNLGDIAFRANVENRYLKHARVPNYNFKAYINVSGDHTNQSGVSVVETYSRLNVKTYDEHRKLIKVVSAEVMRNLPQAGEFNPGTSGQFTPPWLYGEWHHVRIMWAYPGCLTMLIDGHKMAEVELDRPLGHEIKRLCIGYRVGNWRAYGKIRLEHLRLGAPA